MIHASPAFSLAHVDPHSKVRIVGDHGFDALVSITSSKGTSLELLSDSGKSKTIMAFPRPIDIVNADFSWDKELVHVTERTGQRGSVQYSSFICNIQTGATSKSMKHNQLIDGKFIHNKQWQLLHMVGSRITHIAVRVVGKRIEMEKIKGGLHIPEVIWWNAEHDRRTFSMIYRSSTHSSLFNYSEFSFTDDDRFTNSPPICLQFHNNAKLPNRLALYCDESRSLPYLRSSQYRFFVTHYRKQVCLIWQLFNSEESCCAFSIIVHPKHFSRVITVNHVAADVPICFMEKGPIVFVYAPNEFIYMIDLASDVPNIFEMPVKFSLMCCGSLSATDRNLNVLIDLCQGEFYQTELDLGGALAMINKEGVDQICWVALAHLCARVNDPSLLVAVFQFVEKHKVISDFWLFLMEMIGLVSLPCKNGKGMMVGRSLSVGSYSSREPLPVKSSATTVTLKKMPDSVREVLRQFEDDFPSAGSMTRIDSLTNYMKKQRRNTERYEKGLKKLEKENEVAMLIWKALQIWRDKHKPSSFGQMMVAFLIQNESMFSDFPNVPRLRDELRDLACELCSREFGHELAEYGLVGPEVLKVEREQDVDYWRSRFGNIVEQQNESSSASSSSWMAVSRYDRTWLDSSEYDIDHSLQL